MAEAAGLVLGVLGISGLFAACVENFDIVVRGKKFSREFELLCTQVRPHWARLRDAVTDAYAAILATGPPGPLGRDAGSHPEH